MPLASIAISTATRRTATPLSSSSFLLFGSRQLTPKFTTTPIRIIQMGNSMGGTRGAASSPDVAAFIQTEISSHPVVVFSKTYCPYCQQTKQLFAGMDGVDTKVHELDTLPNGTAIQKELEILTHQRTVPNVFVGGKHLGGNDDTQAAFRSGKLQEMLQ